MVEYYANMKNTKMFKLLKNKWVCLEEVVHVLRIVYNATLAFQNDKLTLSDVYGRWTTTQLHLNQCIQKKPYKTGLAKHLHNALEERKDAIYSNPLMFAAIFLDPRFQREITCDESKMEIAKACLMRIGRRMFILNAGIEKSIEKSNASSNNFSFEFNPDEALAQLYAKNTGCIATQTNPDTLGIRTGTHGINIEEIIESFQVDPMPFKESILKYWQMKKEENPELFKLAEIIFSVPPTEVQIERDFSALNFVFSDRRCNLSNDRLEDIMVIHLNRDLFESVNRSDIEQIHERERTE